MKRASRLAAIAATTALLTTTFASTPAAEAGSSAYLTLYNAKGTKIGTLYGSSSVKTLSNGAQVGYARSTARGEGLQVWLGIYAKVTTTAGTVSNWCPKLADTCYVQVAAGRSTFLTVKGVHKLKWQDLSWSLNS